MTLEDSGVYECSANDETSKVRLSVFDPAKEKYMLRVGVKEKRITSTMKHQVCTGMANSPYLELYWKDPRGNVIHFNSCFFN